MSLGQATLFLYHMVIYAYKQNNVASTAARLPLISSAADMARYLLELRGFRVRRDVVIRDPA